jgi:hypothetical protein
MELALPRPPIRIWRERPAEVRALETWLICWILLPNLGYWLLWVIGGPPRTIPILITGLAGIVVHRAPFALKFGLFLVLMVYSAMCFVSALFNLSLYSLAHSLRFAAELSFSASIEYLICGAAILATIAAAWFLLRRPSALQRPLWITVAGTTTIFAASIDHSMAEGNRGSYKRTPDPGAPFTSAAGRSGLAAIATGDRHVLMVMVEAMGQPTDPAIRTRLVDLWARPEVRARYQVITGETLFYGSTTNGEMRELCGRWGEYHEVIERRDSSCLPAALAERGYKTQAWHSFNGTFFDRTTWYPNVGFEEMRFAPELMRDGAHRCPGVFPGACDRDVPRQIGQALRRAREPQFIYWLTVNTHLPVPTSRALGTEACDGFDAALAEDYPMTCRLMQLWDQSGRALASEIAAADFPATDILIVGDHIPPFFDRHHRNQFEPDRVPWILLRPRGQELRVPQPGVAAQR